MKEEKLRLIQEDLGYYHPIDYEYDDLLFIVETMFHVLPAYCISEYFKDAKIGDSYCGNDFGRITKTGNNQVNITISKTS